MLRSFADITKDPNQEEDISSLGKEKDYDVNCLWYVTKNCGEFQGLPWHRTEF